MIGVNQAVKNILGECEFVANNTDEGDWPGLRQAAADLRESYDNIDTPDHVCPLCAQPKHQIELMEFIKGLKSCEVWADDGQSWTIDVASFEGDPDKVCGAMIEVIRGT